MPARWASRTTLWIRCAANRRTSSTTWSSSKATETQIGAIVPVGVIERVPQQARLAAADRSFHAEALGASRRAQDAALRAGAPAVVERDVEGGHIDVQRAAVEGVGAEQLGEDLVAHAGVRKAKRRARAPAPPRLVLLDGLKQPGGFELVHELAGPLAARADLAQHRLVGRSSWPMRCEVPHERTGERARDCRGPLRELVSRRADRRDTRLDVGGSSQQPSRVARRHRDRALDVGVGELGYVGAQQLRRVGIGQRAKLDGVLEERIGGRLQVERLGSAVAGDDPGGALERPELVSQTPEHPVGDRRRDPVDHQAHRTLQLREPLAEEVDELHQDRRLGDLPERPIRHRQRPQVLDPASAGAAPARRAAGPERRERRAAGTGCSPARR